MDERNANHFLHIWASKGSIEACPKCRAATTCFSTLIPAIWVSFFLKKEENKFSTFFLHFNNFGWMFLLLRPPLLKIAKFTHTSKSSNNTWLHLLCDALSGGVRWVLHTYICTYMYVCMYVSTISCKYCQFVYWRFVCIASVSSCHPLRMGVLTVMSISSGFKTCTCDEYKMSVIKGCSKHWLFSTSTSRNLPSGQSHQQPTIHPASQLYKNHWLNRYAAN